MPPSFARRLPLILVGLFAMSCCGQTKVPTSHNDNWRTGQNTSETHLKTSSFAKQRFWAALQNFPAVKPAAGTNLRSASSGREQRRQHEGVRCHYAGQHIRIQCLSDMKLERIAALP
jgi:hypothetical protein